MTKNLPHLHSNVWEQVLKYKQVKMKVRARRVMNKVYILEHCYEKKEDDTFIADEVKILGIYTSRKLAVLLIDNEVGDI